MQMNEVTSMEKSNLDDLLISLDDEIERKCFQINEKKREKIKRRIFLLACLLFFLVPFLLHNLGLSLLAICFPALIFLEVSMILLLPVVIINTEVS